MINVKTLTEEQVKQIRQWADSGIDMNGMQKKLNAELGMSATFMDTRFLLLDLNIELNTPILEEEKPIQEAPSPVTPLGVTRVTIDEITPPHALIAGKVIFSSGAKGAWFADKSGRIEWSPLEGEPTQADLEEFNKELQRTLRSRMGSI